MGICGEHNFYPPFLPPPPPPGFWVNPARLGRRRQGRSRKRKKATTDASPPFPFFFVLFFPPSTRKGKVESIRGLSRCHITSRARNLQIGGKERKRKIFAFTGKTKSSNFAGFFFLFRYLLLAIYRRAAHLEEKKVILVLLCPKVQQYGHRRGEGKGTRKCPRFAPFLCPDSYPPFFPGNKGERRRPVRGAGETDRSR